MKQIVYGATIVLVGLVILVLRPLPAATEENSIEVSALVRSIAEVGGPGDIGIRLVGDPNYYYINRGVESGLNVRNLKESLQGKKISLYYIDHWTPVDPKGKSRHISKIVYNEKVYYAEF